MNLAMNHTAQKNPTYSIFSIFSLTAAVLAASMGLGMSSTAMAADAVKGKATLESKANNCASCHGADYAKSTDDSIPSLAGQHQDYLVQALKQYKAGDTKGAALARSNAIMTPKAKLLSDSDIENIAAYLASLKGHLSVKK